MKKAKMILWLVIVGAIAVFVYQNKSYFLSSHVLHLNLGYADYQTPALPNGIFVFVSFLIGLIAAYLYTIADRLRAKKALKSLQETIASHLETISSLKKEVDELKESAVEEKAEGEEAKVS